MADALVSPAVAATSTVVAVSLVATAIYKVRKIEKPNLVPLMGIMGAFIFAAQMLNFSIPGTGSSGHIVGGVLLAAILGPWPAFLTLSSVLVIQCLVFADGGLMALGCNIINMAALTCLIAYPLIFKPLIKYPASTLRLMLTSCLACTVGLLLGALCVTIETELSGITLLPTAKFLMFMLPIHLIIGIIEGVATGAVLYFVQKSRPELLYRPTSAISQNYSKKRIISFITVFTVITIFFGVAVSRYASQNPDGLEWSIEHTAGTQELPTHGEIYSKASKLQSSTSALPDYENHFSGLIGAVAVVVVAGGLGAALQRHRSIAKAKK